VDWGHGPSSKVSATGSGPPVPAAGWKATGTMRPDRCPRSRMAWAGPVGSDRIGLLGRLAASCWVIRVTGSTPGAAAGTVTRSPRWRRRVAGAGWPLTSTLGGRRPCGARCGQRPTDPRPWQAAQGVPGPALRSGRPAATWSGPRPSRSPTPLAGVVPRRPRQSARPSARAAPIPGGLAAAWWAREKECGGGHGSRRGVDGPGSSSWAPAATAPMTARSDERPKYYEEPDCWQLHCFA
jgi:hypothetical protein